MIGRGLYATPFIVAVKETENWHEAYWAGIVGFIIVVLFASPTVANTSAKTGGVWRIEQKPRLTVYIGKDWPFGNDAQMVTTEGPSAAAVDCTASFGGVPWKTEI